MARKNSKKAMDINEISYEYDIEENGFSEEIIGTPIASFSFNPKNLEDPIKPNPTATTYPVYEDNTKTVTTLEPTLRYEESITNTDLPEKHFTLLNNSLISRDKSSQSITDNRKGKATPNGITPPINGEAFDLKRTYAFRKSTIRKLNELKAIHEDINVYLSTILDEAITEYYNKVLGKTHPSPPSTDT